MKFLRKLESIKEFGAYNINITYGEGVGCDDGNVPMQERSIKLSFTPVGCLGSAMIFWRGPVASFLAFDFSSVAPKKVGNPPGEDTVKDDGYYIWGSDDSVETVLKKFPPPPPLENFNPKNHD